MKLKERIQRFLHDEKLKRKLYVIIFESDTPAGKLFDVILIGCILVSVLLVIIESLQGLPSYLTTPFVVLEYLFTAFFMIMKTAVCMIQIGEKSADIFCLPCRQTDIFIDSRHHPYIFHHLSPPRPLPAFCITAESGYSAVKITLHRITSVIDLHLSTSLDLIN